MYPGYVRKDVDQRYLSKEQAVTLTIPGGTPIDSEGYVEVSPPSGYVFVIRYFKLSTDPEVYGNILLTGLDGVEARLLAEDQDENLSDQLYDASDWTGEGFVLTKFRVYGKAKVDTTADRNVVAKWCGHLRRWW